MSNRNVAKVLLLVALLGLSLVPFSQARPGRGRKTAFGVGLLGGALASVAVSNVMARANQSPAAAPAAAPAAPVAHVHHYYSGGIPVNPAPPAPAPPAPAPIAVAVPAQPDPQKATVIETGAPDANGCYKQIIRQPNPNNPKTYTETEHLICPTLQQVNQPAPQISPRAAHVPVMPQPLPVFQVPGSAAPAPAAASVQVVPVPAPASAPVPAPAGFIVPAGPVQTQPVAPAAPVQTHPAAPVAVPAPAPGPIVPAVQPNAIPQPAQGQPQHVIVQSTQTVKKYPKKRSSAPSLYIPQGVLAMLVLFYSVKSFLF